MEDRHHLRVDDAGSIPAHDPPASRMTRVIFLKESLTSSAHLFAGFSTIEVAELADAPVFPRGNLGLHPLARLTRADRGSLSGTGAPGRVGSSPTLDLASIQDFSSVRPARRRIRAASDVHHLPARAGGDRFSGSIPVAPIGEPRLEGYLGSDTRKGGRLRNPPSLSHPLFADLFSRRFADDHQVPQALRRARRRSPSRSRARPMVPNSAGGYAFAVDDWTRLERFLILGSEGGSYYATERALTVENAKAVVRCLDGRRRRGRSARSSQVSDSGRAPKNDPAVLALAIAAGMGHAAAACEALPKVCRTGTHLFAFAEAVQGFRGWGRGAAQGRRRLVRGQDARGPGLPGRQVPAARRLVAPRPAAPGAPGHGRPRPAGGLPLGRRRGRGARAARGQAGRGGRVVPRRRRAPAAPARRDGRGPEPPTARPSSG